MELPKIDPHPDPQTAKSPEEFATIMKMRGRPIDPNCPFFNNKITAGSLKEKDLIKVTDEFGNSSFVDASEVYKKTRDSFFDKMRSEGKMGDSATGQKTLAQAGAEMRKELADTANRKKVYEEKIKEFWEDLRQKGMVNAPVDTNNEAADIPHAQDSHSFDMFENNEDIYSNNTQEAVHTFDM